MYVLSRLSSVDSADRTAETTGGPSLTRLITSSAIGPLRDLICLRQKQEKELEEKDLEIETLRKDNTGYSHQIAHLEKEVRDVKLELQSAQSAIKTKSKSRSEVDALKAINEALRKKINAQASSISALLDQCAKLKADLKGGKNGTKKSRDELVNETLRKRISAQASCISALLDQCAKLKADLKGGEHENGKSEDGLVTETLRKKIVAQASTISALLDQCANLETRLRGDVQGSEKSGDKYIEPHIPISNPSGTATTKSISELPKMAPVGNADKSSVEINKPKEPGMKGQPSLSGMGKKGKKKARDRKSQEFEVMRLREIEKVKQPKARTSEMRERVAGDRQVEYGRNSPTSTASRRTTSGSIRPKTSTSTTPERNPNLNPIVRPILHMGFGAPNNTMKEETSHNPIAQPLLSSQESSICIPTGPRITGEDGEG
jgi:hypothetical protein